MNPLTDAGYLLPPLVAAGISGILLVLVLRRDWRDPGYRVFSCLLVSLGLWGATIFGMRSSPDVDHALPWDRASTIFAFGLSVFYYHFTAIYTSAESKRVLYVAYLCFALVAVIAPVGLLISDVERRDYGYAPVYGPMLLPIVFVAYSLLIVGFHNLVKAYKRSTVFEERNRLIYLCVAVTFALVGITLDFFLPLSPAGMFGSVLFCTVTAIAVLRYHLLDMHLVIRKGTAYLLMSALVAVPYVGIIMAYRLLGTDDTAWGTTRDIPLWVHFVLLLLLAFGLLLFRGKVQRIVDRWFYRGRYEHLRALQDFSVEAHHIESVERLGSSLVKLGSQALQASGAYLLLPSASGDFGVVSSLDRNPLEFSLGRGSLLVQWLRSNERILHYRDLDILPQLQALSGKERSELMGMDAELFVPLKTKERELVGVLILSWKLSGRPYSEEDERLLYSVASRMAVELENSRLYAMEESMRRELQQQNELKTEFLRSVAHELKTPLTAIISSSEVLGMELPSTTPKVKKDLISSINRSAWAMDRRITELLDFARMQTGVSNLKPQRLEIGPVLTEVVSQLGILFSNKEQSLEVEVPDCLPEVKADKAKLEQILVNLLANANKFSPSGSRITLRATVVDGRVVVVQVEDSAPALAEEERDKVFDPYYRGEDADRRERLPGLGLGLAISKQLVELHQGEIWVDSKPGQGNTFAFSLPVQE